MSAFSVIREGPLQYQATSNGRTYDNRHVEFSKGHEDDNADLYYIMVYKREHKRSSDLTKSCSVHPQDFAGLETGRVNRVVEPRFPFIPFRRQRRWTEEYIVVITNKCILKFSKKLEEISESDGVINGDNHDHGNMPQCLNTELREWCECFATQFGLLKRWTVSPCRISGQPASGTKMSLFLNRHNISLVALGHSGMPKLEMQWKITDCAQAYHISPNKMILSVKTAGNSGIEAFTFKTFERAEDVCKLIVEQLSRQSGPCQSLALTNDTKSTGSASSGSKGSPKSPQHGSKFYVSILDRHKPQVSDVSKPKKHQLTKLLIPTPDTSSVSNGVSPSLRRTPPTLPSRQPTPNLHDGLRRNPPTPVPSPRIVPPTPRTAQSPNFTAKAPVYGPSKSDEKKTPSVETIVPQPPNSASLLEKKTSPHMGKRTVPAPFSSIELPQNLSPSVNCRYSHLNNSEVPAYSAGQRKGSDNSMTSGSPSVTPVASPRTPKTKKTPVPRPRTPQPPSPPNKLKFIQNVEQNYLRVDNHDKSLPNYCKRLPENHTNISRSNSLESLPIAPPTPLDQLLGPSTNLRHFKSTDTIMSFDDDTEEEYFQAIDVLVLSRSKSCDDLVSESNYDNYNVNRLCEGMEKRLELYYNCRPDFLRDNRESNSYISLPRDVTQKKTFRRQNTIRRFSWHHSCQDLHSVRRSVDDDYYWSPNHVWGTLQQVLRRNPPMPDTLKLNRRQRNELCFRLYAAGDVIQNWKDLGGIIGLKHESIITIEGFIQDHVTNTSAGEIILRHWQAAYNKHNVDEEMCPHACTQEQLKYILEHEMGRRDLLTIITR